MDERKCWELRPNCTMPGEGKDRASCPAYREGIGCWELDWRKIVENLPASQQEYWYTFLKKCKDCAAYHAHPEEMQMRIDAVNELYLGD